MSTKSSLTPPDTLTDGLGRLIRVDEPDSSGDLDNTSSPPQPVQSTSYVYDVLDDLVTVTQGTQPSRNFVYDSLKRLTDATNPESGHVHYTYDANSNLATKLDGRSITTTYFYDALNRVTKRTYSDTTPEVDYYYDNQMLPTNKPPNFSATNSIGRLIAVSYGGPSSSAGSYQSYDQLGRVTSSYQQTDSNNYQFGYSYNLASEMTSETYPSGRQVITEYDTAGRIAGVKRDATTYYAGATASDAANRIQYARQGAVSVMRLGNGKWEHTNFNNRLQPTQIGLGTSGTDSSVLKLDYGYGTTSNNGNVISQTITAPGLTLNQCYGYDSLNRLSTAEERSGGTTCSGTQQWKQAFTYDRFGNRNFDVVNTTSNVLAPNPTINQSTNRIASGQNYGYDSAGNLTSDPTTNANGIVYDAENRQTQHTKSGQAANYYYYDGDGHRVKKIDSSGTTVFVYNVGGQLIAEYTSGTPSGGGTSYLTSDHLGSTRVVIKSDGTTTTTTRHDYLPFGEEIQAGIGDRTAGQGYVADNARQKFTQKERDNESGLDYFGARYYSSAQGRFTSVDPMVMNLHRKRPQSWNKYSYVMNNPLVLVDPHGEDWYSKDGKYYWFDGSGKRKGYEHVKIGKEGITINNVQGANGQYARYNGHNITLHNNPTNAVQDRGRYVPPPPVELPDRSGEVGRVLLQFEVLSIAGGIGAAFSGANLLIYSAAELSVDYLANRPGDHDLSAAMGVKDDIGQINDLAKKFPELKDPEVRDAFHEFLRSEKMGMPRNATFKWKDLVDLAKEFLGKVE